MQKPANSVTLPYANSMYEYVASELGWAGCVQGNGEISAELTHFHGRTEVGWAKPNYVCMYA